MRPALFTSLLAVLLAAPVATAGPLAWDDDDLLGDDPDEQPAPPRIEHGDELDLLDDPDDVLIEDDLEAPRGDLLDGDAPVDRLGGEGQDDAVIFREHIREVEGMEPDEELLAWDRYLRRYPNSLFVERIERRRDELYTALYEMPAGRHEVATDAATQEIFFAHGLQLASLNPRTKIQSGFEWGLPDYMNLFFDYEHAITRELSVHGGIRRRFTGWRGEAGVLWAFVKSTRTQTIVSFIGDVHINAEPAFPVLRPQIGAGRTFGPIDAQVQAGFELETRRNAGIRTIGGANVTYRASDNVGAFVESSVYMQRVQGSRTPLAYRYNTFNFGLKLYPDFDFIEHGQLEVNLGATVPYTYQFWMAHFGSIMGQVNFYL